MHESESARPEAAPPSPLEPLLCPACRRPGMLVPRAPGVLSRGLDCRNCGAALNPRDGIPDFAPHVVLQDETINWKQRLMNTRGFARIYEMRGWRPFHAWVASHTSLEQEIEEVLSLSGGVPVRTAVDLACGTGLYAREMARRHPGATLFGIDISISMLAHGRQLAERDGLRGVHFLRGDIYRLPLADASVDHLNCCGALHLFPDMPSIWREIARVLKPGGVFTAMTVLRRPLGKYSFQAFLQRHLTIRFFEPDTLAAELQACGLEDFRTIQRHAALMFGVTRAGTPHPTP